METVRTMTYEGFIGEVGFKDSVMHQASAASYWKPQCLGTPCLKKVYCWKRRAVSSDLQGMLTSLS